MNSLHTQLLKQVNDGTPEYPATVLESFRRLQIRTSYYQDPPPRGAGLRIGILQIQAAWGPGAVAANLERLAETLEIGSDHGVQFLILPELYLPGYTHNPASAREVSEPADGPSIRTCQSLAAKYEIALCVPYGERAESADGPRFYDAAAMINERGELLDSYRKTHLYGQQERDNWDAGDSDFPVHRIHDFPVGMLNCYECEFPELARILALKGAKLIAGPTAADTYYIMPDGTRSRVPYPDVVPSVLPSQAYCNNLFFAYANRCGFEERDGEVWHYRGNSAVIGPHGDHLVTAAAEQDTLLIADCVPAFYGRTHPAPAYHYLRDRRPELYRQLVSQDNQFIDTARRELDLETDLFSGTGAETADS